MTTRDRTDPSPIRSARLKCGMTQARLAADSGYALSYVATVEREPRLLSDRMAERLAQVLGVQPEDLLAGAERSEP